MVFLSGIREIGVDWKYGNLPRREGGHTDKVIEPETGPFRNRTFRVRSDGSGDQDAPPARQGRRPQARPRDYLNPAPVLQPMFELKLQGFTEEEVEERWREWGIEK